MFSITKYKLLITLKYFKNFSFVKIRGGNQYGEVPPNYVCHRCHNPGHWIKNCPNNNTTSVRSIYDTIFNSFIPNIFDLFKGSN